MPSLPSVSAIPGALNEVLSIATAEFPANTTVWYGKELPAYSAPLTFQVTEITGDQNWAELGPLYRREETFALVCSLTRYDGGAVTPDTFPAQLDEVMSAFVTFAKAIANNPDLSGNVRVAEVGNFQIMSDVDANGFGYSTLDFSIRCQQRVNSLS